MTPLLVMWLVTAVPCDKAPPPGMVCIEGGKAILGADDRTPEEKPRHTAEVETFYIDTKEVTVGDYTRCEQVGACPKLLRPSYYASFQKPELPLVPTQWAMAQQYCVYVGKRLPSEAEWEKAARGPEGRTYPWGEEAPTCQRANYKGCPSGSTLPPGSFPPNPQGVYDMAGNGYEWVKDWFTPCSGGCEKGCGEACADSHLRGPCDGASKCKGFSERVLKGGSWYWPEEMLRGSWRRGQSPVSGLHRLSFRCASSSAQLTAWPPRFMTETLAPPADPTPPSAEELAKATAIVEDTDIFQIPPCGKAGKARLDCRDSMSYIKSNEALQYLFGDAIQNVGGGYVGLGADQAYSFIAHARSQWAWLFDYDPAVVRIHYILRAVVKRAPTREDFLAAFDEKHLRSTRAAISEEWASLPEEERAATLDVFNRLHHALGSEYARESRPPSWKNGFGWLRGEDNYRYIRLLFQQGRITAVKGNMLTDKALPSIARAARALHVPIRVYYPSNAEEQWRQLPTQYRDNVRQFPFDERTVLLRTIFSHQFRKNNAPSPRWHYIIEGGLHAQEYLGLPGYANVYSFMEDRHQVGAYLPLKESGSGGPGTGGSGTEGSGTGGSGSGGAEVPLARFHYLDYLSYIGVSSSRAEPRP